MLSKDIPDQIVVATPPFIGTYVKRSGSQRDRDLFCWFNSEDDAQLPHVSISVSSTHNVWEEFHVTYPLRKYQSWSDELEKTSYHVYLRISQLGNVEKTSATNTQGWRLPENHHNFGYADMDRKALLFATNFYRAAIQVR
jgi:hypothetical protein